MNKTLVGSLTGLISAFRYKADEYRDAIKMGRTQLQDAVPMTFGQEFNAYADNLEEEILNLERNVKLLHEINMGGTAIGTGLNASTETFGSKDFQDLQRPAPVSIRSTLRLA